MRRGAKQQGGEPAADLETEALNRIGKGLALDRREAERVRAVIIRDAEQRERDRRRVDARAQVDVENFVNFHDTKDGPTPEQLAGGTFEPFEADRPKGTARDPISTVKRVDRVEALWRRGVLEDHERAACRFYRDRFDRSGLDPLVASSFEPRYGTAERAFGHLARSNAQAEARDDFRIMADGIPADVRPLFDAVVLRDLGIEDAGRAVSVGYRNTAAAFRRALLALWDVAQPLMPTDRKKSVDANSEIEH